MTKRFRASKTDYGYYKIYDKDKFLCLAIKQDWKCVSILLDLLNKQDNYINNCKTNMKNPNPAFERVLTLMNTRGLTWSVVADILDEHTIQLEDVLIEDIRGSGN